MSGYSIILSNAKNSIVFISENLIVKTHTAVRTYNIINITFVMTMKKNAIHTKLFYQQINFFNLPVVKHNLLQNILNVDYSDEVLL